MPSLSPVALQQCLLFQLSSRHLPGLVLDVFVLLAPLRHLWVECDNVHRLSCQPGPVGGHLLLDLPSRHLSRRGWHLLALHVPLRILQRDSHHVPLLPRWPASISTGALVYPRVPSRLVQHRLVVCRLFVLVCHLPGIGLFLHELL